MAGAGATLASGHARRFIADRFALELPQDLFQDQGVGGYIVHFAGQAAMLHVIHRWQTTRAKLSGSLETSARPRSNRPLSSQRPLSSSASYPNPLPLLLLLLPPRAPASCRCT